LLQSLITSKTRVKLLVKFFLNPGTKSYLREIAGDFGESTNAIRVELNRLTDAKILISHQEGRTIQYQVNQKHGFFHDMVSLVTKYVGFDQLIIHIIDKLGNISKAYVIGDYARGIDSGLIDLVLVGNVETRKLENLSERAEALIKRKIRTLVLDIDEWNKLKERLELDGSLLLWESEN
jgi:hypothetical protein